MSTGCGNPARVEAQLFGARHGGESRRGMGVGPSGHAGSGSYVALLEICCCGHGAEGARARTVSARRCCGVRTRWWRRGGARPSRASASGTVCNAGHTIERRLGRPRRSLVAPASRWVIAGA